MKRAFLKDSSYTLVEDKPDEKVLTEFKEIKDKCVYDMVKDLNYSIKNGGDYVTMDIYEFPKIQQFAVEHDLDIDNNIYPWLKFDHDDISKFRKEANVLKLVYDIPVIQINGDDDSLTASWKALSGSKIKDGLSPEPSDVDFSKIDKKLAEATQAGDYSIQCDLADVGISKRLKSTEVLRDLIYNHIAKSYIPASVDVSLDGIDITVEDPISDSDRSKFIIGALSGKKMSLNNHDFIVVGDKIMDGIEEIHQGTAESVTKVLGKIYDSVSKGDNLDEVIDDIVKEV